MVLCLAVIAFSFVAVFGASCNGDDSMNLIFNQGQGSCAAVNQSTSSIGCDEGVFAFEGSILTPNPCYYLKARLDVVNQSNVEIVITATSQLSGDGYCVECVGGISFDGTVEISNACGRSLAIVYNGAVIAEYERR